MTHETPYVDFAVLRELVRQRFKSILPPTSNDDVRLLADDTEQQLIDGLSDRFDEPAVKKWFSWYTSRPDYAAARRIGGRTFDCYGFAGWAGPCRD
jgi:hypothetical protein